MSFFDNVCFNRKLDITLCTLIGRGGVAGHVGDVDVVTKTKATTDLVAVDDYHLFQLAIYVVEAAILVLSEVVETIVLFGGPNVEKTLTIAKEIIPDGIKPGIKLVLLDYTINKVFALIAKVVLTGEELDTLTDTEQLHLRQVRRDDAGIDNGRSILINVSIDDFLESGFSVRRH